jgi:hypothetical protein
MAKAKSMPASFKSKTTPTARAPERAQPRYALGADATMTAEKPFLGAKKGGKIRRK